MGTPSLINENAFIEVIKVIYNTPTENDPRFKTFADYFQKNIVTSGRRIPYTLITRCIFEDSNFYPKRDKISDEINSEKNENGEKLIDEKLEFVDTNINSLLNIAQENKELAKVINKIGDHIKLAIIQRDYIQKNVKELDKDVEFARQHVEKINESKAKIYAEFVSILGIFTGIVIGVMGSLQTISSVFSHINSVPTGKLLAFSSLTAMGVVTIIFLLMKWVSNIVMRTFEKKTSKSNLREILTRNYVYFMSIIVLFYFFILGGTLYFNGLKDFFTVLFGNPVIPFIVIVAIPLVIFNIGYFLIREKKNA